MAKLKGAMPEEGINPVDMPAELAGLWSWFCVLSESRQQGMAGPCRLSSLEILAFFTLEGITPEGWEADAIRRLDRVALEVQKSKE